MKMLTRTTAGIGAAGLVATGLVVTAAPASAHHVFVIRVTEVLTDFDSDFNDPEDAEVGDDFSFTGNLRQDGRRVGKDRGDCEVRDISGDDLKIRCVLRFNFFDTGTIRAAGSVWIDEDEFGDDDFRVRFPIRSGSGDFDDAEGTVENRQVSETKARLIFRMTGVDR